MRFTHKSSILDAIYAFLTVSKAREDVTEVYVNGAGVILVRVRSSSQKIKDFSSCH